MDGCTPSPRTKSGMSENGHPRCSDLVSAIKWAPFHTKCCAVYDSGEVRLIEKNRNGEHVMRRTKSRKGSRTSLAIAIVFRGLVIPIGVPAAIIASSTAGLPVLTAPSIAHAAVGPGATTMVGGMTPLGATFGGSNASSPGVSASETSVAGGVNPATGDYSESDSDLSIPTFGPSLGFTRSYEALLAQQETATGSPGNMGYGWASSYSANVRTGLPIPDYTYRTIGDSGTSSGTSGDGGVAYSAKLNAPYAVVTDKMGDLIIADRSNNRVQIVAAGTTIPFKDGSGSTSTTSGDVYTIAGNSGGSSGL